MASEAKNHDEAVYILYRVLENPASSPDAHRFKEQAITNLTEILGQGSAEDLWILLTKSRPFFSLIP